METLQITLTVMAILHFLGMILVNVNKKDKGTNSKGAGMTRRGLLATTILPFCGGKHDMAFLRMARRDAGERGVAQKWKI